MKINFQISKYLGYVDTWKLLLIFIIEKIITIIVIINVNVKNYKQVKGIKLSINTNGITKDSLWDVW